MASSQRGGLANPLLKTAGLIKGDGDANMRDIPGRKKPQKTQKKLGHRQRTTNIYKGASDQKMLASRISANVSNPHAVRASLRSAATRTGKGATRQGKPNTLEAWREVVRLRYNAEAKFLNLERLAEDETLKKNDIIAPGLPGASPQSYAVIFKLASQLQPPVETISLGHNNIQTGTQIMNLAHYVPNLRNLSLQGNKVRTWRDLEYLGGKGKKLSALRELIFMDNPLRDQEMKAGRHEQYKSGMVRRFPSIEVLDLEAVTKISFDDAPAASTSKLEKPDPFNPTGPSTFPHPMGPSFITGVDGSVISSFLARFLPLFDNQRSALAEVYDPNATFSYSAVTLIPLRAKVQGWHVSQQMPNQRKLEWQGWVRNEAGGSRNLKRIGSQRSGQEMDRELCTLHMGPSAIVAAISKLPATRHEVSGAADKFCMDAWPIGQGAATMLFLCLHGEFAELPCEGIRSFDRTFILAPAPAGSTAAANNWPVAILSDQLTVRNYSSPDAWKPGHMKVQGEALKPARQEALMLAKITYPEVQAQLQAIPEPQRTMVSTLCQRTGLNVKFSVDCLGNNGWELERAVANFEEVKASLGQDAYL